jgi:uncharacterized protein (TIRG00374 family)
MMRTLRSFAARLIVTAAILAYLLSGINMEHTGEVLLRVDPHWFLATLGLVALDRVIMALRWLLLLRSAGVDVSAGQTIRMFLVSSFVGSFLPAGVGGDVSRAYTMASHSSQGSQSVASVGVDRVLGQMALALLGAAGIEGWARHLGPALHWQLSVTACAIAATSLAVLWMDRVVRLALPVRWRDTKLGSRLGRLGAAVGEYRRQPGTLAIVFALSVGVQLLRVLQGYFLGRGLGIDIEFSYYLVIMPIILLVLLLPVSVSGFGLPQAAIVWLFRPVGVPDVESFALSTLLIVIGLLGNLPGALLYAVRRKPVT